MLRSSINYVIADRGSPKLFQYYLIAEIKYIYIIKYFFVGNFIKKDLNVERNNFLVLYVSRG